MAKEKPFRARLHDAREFTYNRPDIMFFVAIATVAVLAIGGFVFFRAPGGGSKVSVTTPTQPYVTVQPLTHQTSIGGVTTTIGSASLTTTTIGSSVTTGPLAGSGKGGNSGAGSGAHNGGGKGGSGGGGTPPTTTPKVFPPATSVTWGASPNTAHMASGAGLQGVVSVRNHGATGTVLSPGCSGPPVKIGAPPMFTPGTHSAAHASTSVSHQAPLTCAPSGRPVVVQAGRTHSWEWSWNATVDGKRGSAPLPTGIYRFAIGGAAVVVTVA